MKKQPAKRKATARSMKRDSGYSVVHKRVLRRDATSGKLTGPNEGSDLRTPDEKKARALEIAGKRSARTVLHVSEMPFREPTQKERVIAESLIPLAKRALSEHGKRKAS